VSKIAPFRVSPARDDSAELSRAIAAAFADLNAGIRQGNNLDWQRERLAEQQAQADKRAAEARAERDAAKAQAVTVGTALAGGNYEAGAQAALAAGDIKTGVDLMRMGAAEKERQRAEAERRAQMDTQAQARAEAAAAAKRDKDGKLAANAILDLDPDDPQFAVKYSGTVRQLRSLGFDVPRHYDDPVLGYRLARSEIMDYKSRAAQDEARAARRNGTGPADPIQAGVGVDENGRLVGGGGGDKRTEVLSSGSTATYRPSTSTTGGVEFGEKGVGSEEVPGVVVNRSGNGGTSASSFATREAQGQAAMANATPEQQARLKTMMENNRRGMIVHGRPPKAGHMYDEFGMEKPIGELTKGQNDAKTQDAIISRQIKMIDNATKTLLDTSNLGRGVSSGLDEWAAGRALMGVTGFGEKTAQAFKDYEQGVLSAVYAMSGKQTTNAEMERFLRTYMPKTGDGAARIKEKADRITGMLQSIRGKMANGKDFDKAFADASAEDAAKAQKQQGGANSVRDQLKAKYGLQ